MLDRVATRLYEWVLVPCVQLCWGRWTSGSAGHKTGRLDSDARGILTAFCTFAFSLSLINSIWVTFAYPYFIMFSPIANLPALLRDEPALAGVEVGGWLEYALPICQLIYLLWNSLNDPLFAYWSDNKVGDARHEGSGVCLRTRLLLVGRSSMCLALAFLLAWAPPSQSWAALGSPSGWPDRFMAGTLGRALSGFSVSTRVYLLAAMSCSHFLLVFALYDSALTLIEVNLTALVSVCSAGADDAEVAGSLRRACLTREALTYMHSFSSLLGSLPITVAFAMFPVDILWGQSQTNSAGSAAASMVVFQCFCAVISATVVVMAWAVARVCKLPDTVRNVQTHSGTASPPRAKGSVLGFIKQCMVYCVTMIKHLVAYPRFMWFAALRLGQSFLCHFEKNHLLVLVALLITTQRAHYNSNTDQLDYADLRVPGLTAESLDHAIQVGSFSEVNRPLSTCVAVLLCLSFVLPHLSVMFMTRSLQKSHTTTVSESAAQYNEESLEHVCVLVDRILTLKLLLCGSCVAMVCVLLWQGSDNIDPMPDLSTQGSEGLRFGSLVSRFPWRFAMLCLCLVLCMVLSLARVVTESMCRLLPMLSAGLRDSLSSEHIPPATFVGIAALAAKPGESMAPIFGWWLFGPSLESFEISIDLLVNVFVFLLLVILLMRVVSGRLHAWVLA